MSHHYKTLVISDLHLGVKASKAKEVVKFLKTHTCDTLILNGDIIDGWQLRKSGKWKKKHSRFFKLILKMMKDKKMNIIYLRGNHDDFLDEIMPFEIGNFCIKNEHILVSGSKKYLVIHGDLFDAITTKLKWLSKLGDVGYTFLLWLNRHYNHYRVRKGLPYYSLSQVVKQKVKSAVSFISAFENELAAYAKNRNCQGVITGHIHQAADKMLGDIHYLNSGDWVESLTALAETHDHHWRIITYSESVMSKSKLKEEIENLLTEKPYNCLETA